tara:strand:- start:34573 stop:34791 length:219 start_codon:yes stop_codon:yes gene_type:complete
MRIYESAIGRHLTKSERSSFISMLNGWNEFGIQAYVQKEKDLLSSKSLTTSELDIFVEDFIGKFLNVSSTPR